MPSIFMGPYPSRFTRAPSVLAKRQSRCGLACDGAAAPPALTALYAVRAYGSPAQMPQPAAAALSHTHSNADSTQLATLPTTFVTQMKLWRPERTCCASAAASNTPSLVEPPTHLPHRLVGGVRQQQQQRRGSGVQWASLTESLARYTAEDAGSHAPLDAAALAVLLAAPGEAVVGDNGAASAASTAAATSASSSSSPSTPSTSAANASKASLHTARRHYGSAAANADPENVSSSNNDNPHDDEGENAESGKQRGSPRGDAETEEDAAPAFEDVCAAFRTLGMIGADGFVVRTWTAADIKKAYRALAKELHPDVAGGSSAQMERVNSAYDCVCGLTEESADNYRVWLEMGGEVELLACDTQLVQRLLRFTSRDAVQFMLVGWCTTLSGAAAYAGWAMLYGHPGKVHVNGTTAAAAGGQGNAASRHAAAGGRLTFPRAGAALSSAPGVQYGVVSTGGTLFASSGLSQWGVQAVRAAVSRYALAVVLTVAACVNTVMVQRVLLRLLTGSA